MKEEEEEVKGERNRATKCLEEKRRIGAERTLECFKTITYIST